MKYEAVFNFRVFYKELLVKISCIYSHICKHPYSYTNGEEEKEKQINDRGLC